MYGRKACQLVKEIASAEKGQLTPFSSDLCDEVIEECKQHYHELECLIRRMEEQGLNVETAKNEDHYGALIHHLLFFSFFFCVKEGSSPWFINENGCNPNTEHHCYFTICLKLTVKMCQLKDLKYAYCLVDAPRDMVPPKDPYIKVRVLDDMGGDILLSDDKKANFTRHSMHFLKRTDAEQLISQGKMEELKD
uniref:DNA replication complex GINS protein PSF1 n=1 Tax=Fragaria vesca subsp. vesca TaxID=101020 RepID=UPI0005C9F494|nr:PREDICTED: DNA replication complex GINS protein PSF1 [Fragaria vesca subsp. vesca]